MQGFHIINAQEHWVGSAELKCALTYRRWQ